jgi:replicative DNA helicase
MADVQHALLSKAILDRELPAIISARITADFFEDEQMQRVFDYLVKHWTKYSEVPDEVVVQRAFPTQRWVSDNQPVEYHIEQLQTRRRKTIVLEALGDAALVLQSAKDDPDHVDKIVTGLTDAVTRATVETSGRREADITSLTEVRKYSDLLSERAENQGLLRGITTGFDGIDFVTGGLQPEHFVVLFGLPKSFKSATLLAMANAAHLDANMPLFIGFEMSQEEQLDRLISLRAQVNLNHILNGTTTRNEDRRIKVAQSRLMDMRPFLFSTDTESALTVAGINALIQEKNPDVVFIDGIYFMRSALPDAEPGSSQALTDISRSLKRLCQSSKKPIVVTSQASQTRTRNGRLTLASGMYTQAFGQDANIVLGTARQMGKDEDEESDEHDTGPVTVRFSVLASRSGPRKETLLEWDWNEGRATELSRAVMNERLNTRTNPTPGTSDNEGFA